jgi:hypothetical protein
VQAAAGQIVASRLPPMTMFFELPRPETSAGDAALADETRADETRADETRAQAIQAAVAALAEYKQTRPPVGTSS